MKRILVALIMFAATAAQAFGDGNDTPDNNSLGTGECEFITYLDGGILCGGETDDDFVTYLTMEDPTGVNYVEIPDASGTVCVSGQACPIDISAVSGLLPATNGGTGQDFSAATGLVLMAAGTASAGPLSGDVATSGLVATIQANSVALTTDTSGTLSCGEGGTGAGCLSTGSIPYSVSGVLTESAGLRYASNGIHVGDQASDGDAFTGTLTSNSSTASTWVNAQMTANSSGPSMHFIKGRGDYTTLGNTQSGDTLGCIETYGIRSSVEQDGPSLCAVAKENFSSGTANAGDWEVYTSEGGNENKVAIFKTNKTTHFVPLASAPGTAAEGDCYYDSALNRLRCYDGGAWRNLATTQPYTWNAGNWAIDGTNCDTRTEQELVSGAGKEWAVHCADSGSSVFYFTIPSIRSDYDGGAFTIDLTAFSDDAQTATWQIDMACQCTAPTAAVNGSWSGTPRAINIGFTNVADEYAKASNGTALTCSGTCAAGSRVKFRATTNASGTTATMTNVRGLGAVVWYGAL